MREEKEAKKGEMFQRVSKWQAKQLYAEMEKSEIYSLNSRANNQICSKSSLYY